MKQLMMDLHFKETECPQCGGQADPITGEFFADGEVYKVHYFCKHCSQGFEKSYGNVVDGKTYDSRTSIYELRGV